MGSLISPSPPELSTPGAAPDLPQPLPGGATGSAHAVIEASPPVTMEEECGSSKPPESSCPRLLGAATPQCRRNPTNISDTCRPVLRWWRVFIILESIVCAERSHRNRLPQPHSFQRRKVSLGWGGLSPLRAPSSAPCVPAQTHCPEGLGFLA